MFIASRIPFEVMEMADGSGRMYVLVDVAVLGDFIVGVDDVIVADLVSGGFSPDTGVCVLR